MTGLPEIREPTSYPCKSLNYIHRKQKLIEITLQNAVFLKRLKEKKSQYDITIWKNERKKEESILKNICEFQYVLNEKPKKCASHYNSSSYLPQIAPTEKYAPNIVHQQVFETDGKKFIVDVFKERK